MRKRKSFAAMLASALAGIPLAGCCCSPASTGWRFEVMKPPTLMGSALVASGSPPLGLAGLGTGAVVHEVAAVAPVAPAVLATPQRPVAAAIVPMSGCTLEDVCRRLEALERSQRREVLPPPARAMPRGETGQE